MSNTGKSGHPSRQERRRAPRADVELVIEYSDLEHFCQDYARNVSLGGIFIETRRPLPAGSTVQLSFGLPGYGGRIRSSGKVVRSVSVEEAKERGIRPGMGVSFEDLSEESKAVIDSLVRRSLDEGV